jgi:periplasmic protein TonB
MFEDVGIAFKQKNRTGAGIVFSIVLQSLILGILILIPLIYTEALPKAFLTTLLVAPPPPPPPPPPMATVKTVKVVKLITSGGLVAPKQIPHDVTIIHEEAPDVAQGGIYGGLAGQGIMVGTPVAALPPPPKAAAPVRIKQGGSVTAASIVTQTRPVYPPLARQARIQGSVVLHAIIDKDGNVSELQVVSGHPLLVQAALDAVKQWRYRPTLLNGEPVEVDTTITVTFTMGG